jgi:hypothetical protein
MHRLAGSGQRIHALVCGRSLIGRRGKRAVVSVPHFFDCNQFGSLIIRRGIHLRLSRISAMTKILQVLNFW